jgi:hypothetical protein
MSLPARRLRAQVLEGALLVGTLVVGWVAWSLLLWGRGQTPAKQLLHMRCIDTWTGRAAGPATMMRRELAGKWALAVSTLGLSMVVGGLVVYGERREAFWDKTANTIVIDDPHDRYAPRR